VIQFFGYRGKDIRQGASQGGGMRRAAAFITSKNTVPPFKKKSG